MTETRKSFKREGADQRQEALIQSTLTLIAAGGPEAATVRNIAEHAGVTQGLIRHYFSSKEELFNAAYEHHMKTMMDMTSRVLEREYSSAQDRLVAFIASALTPPVVDAEALAIWSGFIHFVQRDDAMRAIHEKTYFRFRDQLELLIKEAFREANILKNKAALRKDAIVCNALIDGLWLEGGALPASFEEGELAELGLTSISAVLGISLNVKEETR